MNITQELNKWGNSLAIRLPKQVTKAARLTRHQTVAITLDGQSIVLGPIKVQSDLSLDEMLRGVTPENVHAEVNWGEDKGAEAILE